MSRNDSHSQFGNCSNLTTDELITLNLAWSATGAGCCLISCVITLLLLISKSYHTVLQRLFLYLMIATVPSEFFLAASIEHHFKYAGQAEVCTWIAFIFNSVVIVRTVFTIGIMVYLFILVWYLAKGNTAPQVFRSKCRRVSAEVVYVVISPVLTFVYASVPLITGDYGLAGAWCWIRALDENCDTVLSGFLSQMFHGYIIFITNGIIGIVLTIAVAVVYCRIPPTLHDSQKLLKKTLFVMLFFFLYVATQVFGFTNRLITARATHYQYFIIWVTVGIAHPLSLLLFPVAFVVSFYPVAGISLCVKALKTCLLSMLG